MQTKQDSSEKLSPVRMLRWRTELNVSAGRLTAGAAASRTDYNKSDSFPSSSVVCLVCALL